MEAPKMIVGIPGFWKNKEAFKEALLKERNGYVYIGDHIRHLENSGDFFEVEVSDFNLYVAGAFEIAGNGIFSLKEIKSLKKHKSIVYVIGDGGSMENALKMMEVASAILDAGGIAVNVESSGRALPKNDWIDITESKQTEGMFAALVQMAREDDYFYTVGMHHFGYRDVITPATNITDDDVETLFNVFCLYTLIENPSFNDGETFSVDPASPVYKLNHENCALFEEDDPFCNPYGIWNLTRHD